MKKVYTLTCVLESKYGTSTYTSVHKTYEDAEEYVDVVKNEMSYDDDDDDDFIGFDYEEFDYYILEHEISWL